MKIEISRISEFFDAIAGSKRLYMPLKKAGSVNYAVYQQGDVYQPEVLNTVKSAKDVFFPQCENMVSFASKGKEFSITPVAPLEEDFVIFGVRACDVQGFAVLDEVFLTDPVDSFYAARRAHGTVISLACTAPEESCFCTTFGIDPTAPKGDIEGLWATDYLYLTAVTDKGTALLESIAQVLVPAPDAEPVKAEYAKQTKELMGKLPFADLTTEGWSAEVLKERFEDPAWDTLSTACIGCGTCTFVCPTCQCYDIKDYNTGKDVKRFRCWDSCMYSDFTMMAHGTPRPDQKQRFRQRFMHKLVYFPDNNDGMFSCVGCGRCVTKCPISMNIVKVMKTMGGKK